MDDRRWRSVCPRHSTGCVALLVGMAPVLMSALALMSMSAQWAAAEDDGRTEARQPIADKFEALDTDRDEKLSVDEFSVLGDETERPRLARNFRVLDLDGDGRLIFDEFLNTPGVVPVAARGRLPDPLTELAERWMSKIQSEWKAWDKNADGELGREEFGASGLARLVRGFESAKFEDWNRDGRGGVSLDDCRSLLEVGCGVRRPDGELLRTPSGRVFNWMAFKHADLNHDDQVDHDEHIKAGFDGDKAEARFEAMDADRSGAISFQEWNTLRTFEPLSSFLQHDTNLDGKVDVSELLQGEPPWHTAIARHAIPAFDLDRDGFLSLHEYRLTPMANHIVKWHEPLSDKNGDGFLSPAEFQFEPGLCPAVLTAEYFLLLDLNHDGRLDPGEFPFITSKRVPKQEFARIDADQNGQLNETELAGALGDKPHIERVLLLFDLNHDRLIGYDEFLTVPGLVPADARGRFPDPIVKLVDAQMAAIEEKWTRWDKNGDKVLGRDEFQSSGLARLVAGLALSTLQDWGRDADGSVSQNDCRRLLEIAFGVRRLKGEPLRFESGITINAMLFSHIDQNGDDRLGHEEYVKHGFDGEQAEARFAEADTDRDGSISFLEWTRFEHRWNDPIGRFLAADADLDGRLGKEEFLKGHGDWELIISRYVFPGFDLDRDGFLSLDEYRGIPLANFFVAWHAPRRDSNDDGLLSSGDFQWGRRPALAGLEAEYFRRLDVNRDGSLDLHEFFFLIDPIKAPREAIFIQRDRDEDGQLSFDEILGDFKPPAGSKPDPAYELRLARIEEAFRRADADHDQHLSLAEFRSPAGMEAIDPDVALARSAVKAASTGIAASTGTPDDQKRMWLIVGGNVILLLAVFIYVAFKKRPDPGIHNENQ